MESPHKADSPTLRDLYPNLSEDELQEAEKNLDRYIAVVLRIQERLRNDPDAHARFHELTDCDATG